jgi:hypothetical protein
VLKISGRPYRASASSTASTQKSTSSVIDSRHARTRRLNQSTTAEQSGSTVKQLRLPRGDLVRMNVILLR